MRRQWFTTLIGCHAIWASQLTVFGLMIEKGEDQRWQLTDQNLKRSFRSYGKLRFWLGKECCELTQPRRSLLPNKPITAGARNIAEWAQRKLAQYSYCKITSGGPEERYSERIDKNQYFHICDARGYLLGFAGKSYPQFDAFKSECPKVRFHLMKNYLKLISFFVMTRLPVERTQTGECAKNLRIRKIEQNMPILRLNEPLWVISDCRNYYNLSIIWLERLRIGRCQALCPLCYFLFWSLHNFIVIVRMPGQVM